jgi:DNA-binding CsgD family transcriptional regulator
VEALKCPRCGCGLNQERLKLLGNIARENATARLAKYKLTPKERATVELIIDGLPYRDIAADLGSSVQVVKNRLTRVYDKVGCQSRSEMLAMLIFGEAG